MSQLWRFTKSTFTVVGGVVTAGGVLGGIGFGVKKIFFKEKTQKNTVLYLTFAGKGLRERPVPRGPFPGLMEGNKKTLSELIEAIRMAQEDENVKGIVANVGSLGDVGMAQLQELKAAIEEFGSKDKKFTLSFAETFDQRGFYLATSFKEIHLQPSGNVELVGFLATNLRFRELLDKIGLLPRIESRYEYKAVGNMLTEKEETEAEKEDIQRVYGSYFEQLVNEVAAKRNITTEKARALVNEGPHLSEDCLKSKLVDALGYKDQVIEHVKIAAGPGAVIVPLGKYYDRKKKEKTKAEKKKKDAVAVIYAVGMVKRGAGKFGSEEVAHAFRKAIKDDSVKAIVLRIDSGGGDYVAADRIWREVSLAKKAGKPVVASFGNVAASGGYYVATPCDHIVSQPATITGSIGVFSGKLVVTDKIREKTGFNTKLTLFGENSNMFSPFTDFSAAQKEKFDKFLDRIYEDFTTKVIEGRKLSANHIDQVARGRVFVGTEALKIGLVDSLGGLTDAVKVAKDLAKLGDHKVVQYPPCDNPFKEYIDYSWGRDPDSFDREDRSKSEFGFGDTAEMAINIRRIYTQFSAMASSNPTNVLRTNISWRNEDD